MHIIVYIGRQSWRCHESPSGTAVLLIALVALTIGALVYTRPSAAISASGLDPVLDAGQVRIMASANPGGGWDQTARAMQAALVPILGRTEVYNVGGAGGTIGLAQYQQLAGQPNELMVMGLIEAMLQGTVGSRDGA
jgi:putative tricarboxylic transport membrane protein